MRRVHPEAALRVLETLLDPPPPPVPSCPEGTRRPPGIPQARRQVPWLLGCFPPWIGVAFRHPPAAGDVEPQVTRTTMVQAVAHPRQPTHLSRLHARRPQFRAHVP